MMTNLFDFTDIEKEEKNPYERYGLKRNPFPKKAISSPKVESPFVQMDEAVLKKLDIFIRESLSSQKWGGLPLVGSYGSGKTRLLLWLEHIIKEKLSKDRFAIAYYISNPGNDIFELYSNIFNTIGFNQLLDMLYLSLKDEIKPVVLNNIGRRYLGEKTYGVKDFSKLIQELSNLIIRKNIIEKSDASDAIVYPLLNHAIDVINSEEKYEIIYDDNFSQKVKNAEKFLRGNKLSKSEISELKIKSEKLSKDDIIKYALPLIINIHKQTGFKMLFILLDEFEHIIKGSKSQLTTFLNDFRNLIDANLMNFSMILACILESWYVATKSNPGFEERFISTIDLPKLSEESGKLVIVEYSNLERLNEIEIGKLTPFKEEVIKDLITISDYNIRKYIELCHEVLSKAAFENVSDIDRKFIAKHYPK